MSLKSYDFDKKLDSLEIKYIEREIVDNVYQNITCDRCNHQRLKYINILRIDEEYYQIGDDCYDSIKNILSKVRGKSLYRIRLELEESYDRHLERKYDSDNQIEDKTSYKFDPDYSRYLTLKWDSEHSGLPSFRREEFEELRKKFEKQFFLFFCISLNSVRIGNKTRNL